MKMIFIPFIALILLAASCASDNPNKRTYAGAGIGTAVGAGIGAMAGGTKGAVIGGAIGAGIGGYAGHRMDKQAAELEKVAETKRTEMGLVTKLKSDILFDTGKAKLKSNAVSNLNDMAEIMKKYPENVLTIKGYTDDTGSSKTNEKLSLARADAVKNALVKDGLPVSTITTQGLGPANPIASNGSQSGRKQNRRVEIEITVDKSKVPKNEKQAEEATK